MKHAKKNLIVALVSIRLFKCEFSPEIGVKWLRRDFFVSYYFFLVLGEYYTGYKFAYSYYT